MEEKYPIQLTLGQALFVFCLLVGVGFVTFYLGARFGPEMFWGFNQAANQGSTIIPQELSISEIEEIIKATPIPNLSFHHELEDGAQFVYQTKLAEPNPPAVLKIKSPTPPPSPIIEDNDARALEHMIEMDLDP